jgi:Txe/YoeB family toxin of Txe-Axe toxin-antitoxin module
MKLVWDEGAWDDYGRGRDHHITDRKILQRINTLIRDVARNGNEEIGKADPSNMGFTATGPGASPMSTDSSTSSARTRYE